MSDYFLEYLIRENSNDSFQEILEEIITDFKWNSGNRANIPINSPLNQSEVDLRKIDVTKSSNEIISELYCTDSPILFLILFYQRIINQGELEEIYTYNSDFENHEFVYDPEVHEHIYMTDVKVFMVRTKNQIYIFGDSCDQYYEFEEIIISSDGTNLNSDIATKTFDRLGINSKRNFSSLLNIIEAKFK
ncbi:hypothetical protein U8593_09025 [Aquirufa antheringensis]